MAAHQFAHLTGHAGARTLPTSPLTIVVTNPPPVPIRFTTWAFAALTMASVAATKPISPSFPLIQMPA